MTKRQRNKERLNNALDMVEDALEWFDNNKARDEFFEMREKIIRIVEFRLSLEAADKSQEIRK
jgi:hypothetical protein